MNSVQPGAPSPADEPNLYAAPAAYPTMAAAPAGYPCARCGAIGADFFPADAAPMHRACAGLGPDVLAWPWLILAYSVTIPFGCSFFGALLASIPYYVWRAKYPLRAKSYNRHVWIAFGVSCLFWGSLAVSQMLYPGK